MRSTLTSVLVDDQDKALRFYTEVLGFVKKRRDGALPWNLAPGNEALMAGHAFDTVMAALDSPLIVVTTADQRERARRALRSPECGSSPNPSVGDI